ncbi:acyl-CoA dehydrogenase [Actibacterium sp.]|uniref:acyl-CoA dehydrogenase n=1 Tax=Actibacterium sp. TaxID=1872125 RepID=UPI0035625ABA
MPYQSPVADIKFIFDHVVGLSRVADSELYAEATPDVTDAILIEAGRLCDSVLGPLQRAGDLIPAKLENGKVRSTPGYAEAFAQIAEGGWIGTSADPEYGGMGLPISLTMALHEMLSGSCLSLQLHPLLTQGQIDALEHHASAEIKDLYLPKLISGEWHGTMNLTEPQAGSDVGAVSTKATENGDGTFAITGQKIFITWGDSDFNTNTCHLVLARLPDGGPGTRGISLFMVPKFLPDENGAPGVGNTLGVVSIEHKLGLHGSPTCVMQFDGAKGWLVGERHKGMAAMFTMMNAARVGVAMQGIGTAEAAYQHALAYALERKQGATPVENGTGTIIDFPDVRRMLTTMKAEIFAARSIALACSVAIDMGRATGDADHKARAALLTPIAKAYCTDMACEVSSLGVQIFGGMGFVEESGAAQFYRDARITPIYEGTNGIQAMDLVGRTMMDGGDAAFRMLQEIQDNAEAARGTMPDLANEVWEAAESLREATETLPTMDMNDRFSGAVPYLRAFARVLGAHFHLTAAMAVGAKGPRCALASFFIRRLLPEHGPLLVALQEGAAGLYALSPEDLAR